MKPIGNLFSNRHRCWLTRLLILTPLFLIGAGQCWGQGYGSLTGTVSDSSGAVIPSAAVTAVQAQTGTTTALKSNETGGFVFPSLPPAEYTVSVTAAGFQTYTRSNIALEANQSVTLKITMQLGAANQVINVAADAPQVDTTTGTLSEVIDTARVNDLPLNGRNAAQLTTLVTGVVVAPANGTDQGQTKTFPVAVVISANGSRENQNNYLLDGGNNVDEYTIVNAPFPFPDALQEFSVQTSNYTAQYGENAGAVVNIVTKSGGSQFHGDLFEYLRNGYFNARNYFATAVDPLKRNQFGGTIGGPVILPAFHSKNTFFFFGYQKTIVHSRANGKTAYVPTIANRNGDFSALLNANDPANPLGKVQVIYDPQTGLPFPNNKIDQSRFDPAVVSFEQHLPAVSGNGLVQYALPVSQNFNEFVARLDKKIGSADQFFARYYYNDFDNAGSLDPANLLTYADGSNIRYQTALLGDTHSFTPNLLDNVIVNYTREVSVRGPLSTALSVGDFGVNIYQPAAKAIQTLAATGFFSIGDNPRGTFERNNYTLHDDLFWVKGRHSLSFGGDAELTRSDVTSDFNEPGLFTFNANTTGYALASLQLGYLYQFNQGSGQFQNVRNHFFGFYGQDSWKLSDRLTFNFGLRYEPFYPWSEARHRIEQFSPSAYAAGRKSVVYPNAPAGLLFPGDAGVPEQGVHPVYSNLMPRLGFAADLLGNGLTVIRGGAGMFFNTRLPAMFNQTMATLTPYSVTVTLTNPQGTFSNPYAGTTNPFPQPSPAPSNVVFPSPVQAQTYDPSGNFAVPVTYDWNLTGEQQLARNLLARLAYVGSHSSHIVADLELNPARYIPGSTLTTNQRRVYSGFSNISDANMGANSNYNALQATLEERIAHGLRLTVNYTWSKAMDTVPIAGLGNTADVVPQSSYVYPWYFPNFKSLDIGPSDFDRRHVLSASYVYTLPKLADGSMLWRGILNGWETAGLVAAESGDPVTVTAGSDVSQTNILQDRAQTTGQNPYGTGACKVNSTCKNWFNPQAFALPAIGSFGNVQKSAYRGPKYVEWDASILRNFQIAHEREIQFRAEYFDLLNHPNFADPNSAVAGAGFGSITSTGNYQPRIAQFSLKAIF